MRRGCDRQKQFQLFSPKDGNKKVIVVVIVVIAALSIIVVFRTKLAAKNIIDSKGL